MAERPTPQAIALCTLIALHSDPSFDLYDTAGDEDIDDIEEQLARILQKWVLSRDTTNDGSSMQSLVWLLQEIKTRAGEKTCKLILEYVEMSASSIDALIDLMESLRASVSEGIVDGTSSTGIYLRKICLGFDELSFEAATRLWEALRNNVDYAKNVLTKASNAEMNDSSTLVDDNTEWSWPPSSAQQESFLKQKCLEQDGDVLYSFEDTEKEIMRVLARDPELPAAHFLRFLNCLQHGERVGALDALHQYFDYAMIKDRKEAARMPNQDVLQYAGILLAAVHSSFGDKGLSLKATEEAVRVAQASGDKACVAYALGWLFQNTKSELRDEELLKRCAFRAIDNCLRSLAGGAKLSLTRHSLVATTEGGHGGVSQDSLPAHAWESLMEGSTDRSSAGAPNLMDRPTHMTDLVSSNDATDILARQCLVGAGVWDAFGFTVQSALSSFVAIQCFAQKMPDKDVAVAMQNIARITLHGNGSQTIPMSCKSGNIHSHLENLGKTGPSGPSCAYNEAIEKINELRNMEVSPVSGVWSKSVVLVLNEWALRRAELGFAESLACQLHSYLHPRISNYQEVTLEAWKQHSLLLCRQHHWEKAKKLTKRLCFRSKEWGLRTQHAGLLMQLAMIHLGSSGCQNFICALDPLLECLSFSKKYAMDSYHATALSLLAQVHLQLRNTKLAVALLRASLPSILRHAHIWFQGEAFLTLCKCELHQAKHHESSSFEPGNNRNISLGLLRSAANNLDKSRDVFERCHDMVRLREVYYLQARVYHKMPGQKEKRNRASKQFLTASSHLAKLVRLI